MKKQLFFILMPFLLLSGCGNKDDDISEKPKETVKLTIKNFSMYVAVNESSTCLGEAGSGAYVIYYAYFKGADYCKFIDCVVSYQFVNSSSPETYVEGTAKLNLSGDGQADPYHPATSVSKNYFYTLSIINVQGTVLVYR